MKHVLGIQNVVLSDGPNMCVQLDPKTKRLKVDGGGNYLMTLPLSDSSRRKMWGMNVEEELPLELIWTIIVGGLFHEIGHLISGEPVHTEALTNIIANVVNDANENNVIPNEWFGSIRYLNVLNQFFCTIHKDVKDLPMSDLRDQFQTLMSIANRYRINLSLPYNKQLVQTLPPNHPLARVFKRLKPVMEGCRREFSPQPKVLHAKRERLIDQYRKIVQKWYQNQPDEAKEQAGGKSLSDIMKGNSDSTGGNVPQENISLADAQDFAEKAKQEIDDTIKEDCESAISAGQYDEVEAKENKDRQVLVAVDEMDSCNNIDRLVQNLEFGVGHGTTSSPFPPAETDMKAIPDQNAVHDLRGIFKRLMFGRAYKGRKVDIIGRKLHSPNFYQVKLTDKPAILRDIGRVKTGVSRTDVVFCFDRSGSMRMDKRDVFSRKVMATFYAAVRPIRELSLVMYGFDRKIYPIKNDARVYYNIERNLTAKGGTDFPLAERVAIRTLERSTADRKLAILLTDGDVSGSYGLAGLKMKANQHNIRVIVLDVANGSAQDRKQHFHDVVFMKDIKTLLKELKKVARQRF